MENSAPGKSAFTQMMHVGLVVKDMDQAIERFTRLGIGPFKPFPFPPDARETFRGKPFIPSQRVTIQKAQMSNMELELIQPLDGESPHREFLEQKGEGIQHLGFYVKDLDKEVDHLTAGGSEILLKSPFKGGGGICYLDLKAAGLIVELVQPGNR